MAMVNFAWIRVLVKVIVPDDPNCPHQQKCGVKLDQIVIQHTHNEWSSVTSPGLTTIGL